VSPWAGIVGDRHCVAVGGVGGFYLRPNWAAIVGKPNALPYNAAQGLNGRFKRVFCLDRGLLLILALCDCRRFYAVHWGKTQ
jgi:hypothetical protein